MGNMTLNRSGVCLPNFGTYLGWPCTVKTPRNAATSGSWPGHRDLAATSTNQEGPCLFLAQSWRGTANRYMFFVVKSLHSAAERCWLKRWWFTCRFRCFCVCQPRRLMDIDWFSCGILGASWYEVMDKRPAHPAWPGMAAVSALHHVAAKVALNGRANGATEPQRWRLQRLRCRGRHFIWNVAN
jgi:hypothetical protein